MLVHQSGVCFPVHFPVFVCALRQCMLSAHIGRPVRLGGSSVVHLYVDPSCMLWCLCSLEGPRNFLHASPYVLCLLSFRPAGFARPLSQCLSPGFWYFLLCLFVHRCQCMLLAHFGRPVQSGVFCCPPACGSLVFVVHLCFPWSRWNCYAHAPVNPLMSAFLMSAVFWATRALVHSSGVWVPLHSAVFVPAAEPVQAYSPH